MSDFEPTRPHKTLPPPTSMMTVDQPARLPRLRRVISNRKSRWVLAAAVMCGTIGFSVGPVASASAATTSSTPAAGHGPAGSGSNARSGPAAGGSVGTVGTVSKSGFTLTTSAGQKVTIDETSSTKYLKGKSSTSASAVTKGEKVLVLGTTNSTTITATQITVETSSGTVASTAAQVVPFQSGSASPSKQIGTIPASYTQGQGTIVSGTTANKATEAALAAYPGGVVDRVVKLSNGDYEVHYIGVSWPHHIFVNPDFKVIGANS
jgi:hypothetical protein